MTTAIETITIDPTSLASLANAVALGLTTPEMLADWIGVDLIEDCLVLDGSPIYADDGTAEIEYDSDTSADDAAMAYVESGSWGEITETSWVSVYTHRKGVDRNGAIIHVERRRHKIELAPEEPECIDGHDHVWESPYRILGGCQENPGVWANGGGVIIHECCMVCGCRRTTDTWAQDMSDGEQGLTSTSYSEGEYADEVNARHVQRAKDRLDTESDQTGEYTIEWADADGDMVGADEDDLRDYGIALLLDDDAAPITGTALSTPEGE